MSVTTPLFWDCACDDNFINPISLRKCLKCTFEPHQCPDSHAIEVANLVADQVPADNLDIFIDWLKVPVFDNSLEANFAMPLLAKVYERLSKK